MRYFLRPFVFSKDAFIFWYKFFNFFDNSLSLLYSIKDSIEIIPVKNVDEVLKVALTKPLKRVEWVEVDQISKKDKEYEGNPFKKKSSKPNKLEIEF